MRQLYTKFTLRKPIDFAIVGVASLIAAKDGVCTDARIAIGSVAPAPIRAHVVEKNLIGKEINEQAAAEAAEAAVEGVRPLSKNAYKVQIMKALEEGRSWGNASEEGEPGTPRPPHPFPSIFFPMRTFSTSLVPSKISKTFASRQ